MLDTYLTERVKTERAWKPIHAVEKDEIYLTVIARKKDMESEKM
jgi:hypothetical protein